jgi:hypothetical protein
MLVTLRIIIKKSRSDVVSRSREIHQLIKDTYGNMNWGALDVKKGVCVGMHAP